MEQKRPADIIQELLDYLWNGLGLEEKGWKRLKKGDFKTAGLRPLHRGGGLQLVHLCAGADGGTVRNGGADGGVPPSGGIARNAWTQGKELDGFDVVPPLPRQ